MGAPVRDDGIKSGEGCPHGVELEAKFRVVHVSTASMSVSEIVDAGHQVVFDKVGGIAVSISVHKDSGIPINFLSWRFDWNISP